jgi:hypothetical protein
MSDELDDETDAEVALPADVLAMPKADQVVVIGRPPHTCRAAEDASAMSELRPLCRVVLHVLGRCRADHHSAKEPSAWKVSGDFQWCGVSAARRTACSSTSIPRPGPVGRETEPSVNAKTVGSTR